MTIKVIEGMKPSDVVVKVIEGKRWAFDWDDGWEEGHTIQSLGKAIDDGIEVAIIDEEAMLPPTIEWDKFDWHFFNQYGGLKIDTDLGTLYTRRAEDCDRWEYFHLDESPFYYWPGGECPVPGNVEVEIVYRDGDKLTSMPVFRWWHKQTDGDIIAFRLTGKVY